MALVDCEGFGASSALGDFHTYGLIQYAGGYMGQITTGGPLGDNYFQSTYFSSNVSSLWEGRTFPSTYSTFFYGQRTLINNVGAYSDNVVFCDATGNTLFSTVLNAQTGQVQVYRGTLKNAGTLLGQTSAGVFPVSVWFYLEIGAVMSATAGTVTIRVNGIAVLTLTGVNNTASSSTGMAQVRWLTTGGGSSDSFSVGHVYLCDATGAAPQNTFLGDVRVQDCFPNAPGASTGFAPIGAASNWQVAATSPPLPGSVYNQASTVGNLDLFQTAGITLLASTVYGVQLKTLASKTTAGTRVITNQLKSGATTVSGSNKGLGAAPLYYRDIFQLDPNGNIAWTAANVNAAQFGYTIVS